MRLVSSLGLSTMLQPAQSAGANFQAPTSSGKFHGVIWPTTPAGSRSTMPSVLAGQRHGLAEDLGREPGVVLEDVGGAGDVEACLGDGLAAVARLEPRERLGSSRIRRASSQSTRPRWLGSARDQSPRRKLARAAVTAASMSSALPAGIALNTSPVAGSSMGTVAPLAAGTTPPVDEVTLGMEEALRASGDRGHGGSIYNVK